MSTTTSVTYDADTTDTVGSIVGGTYDVTVLHDIATPSGQLPTVNLTTAVGGSNYNILSLDGAVTNFDETFGLGSVYQLTADGGTINSTQTVTIATQNIVAIENGGTFVIGGTFLNLFESGSTVTFGGTNNTLNIEGAGLQGSPSVLTLGTNTAIDGFAVGANDIINDSFINYSSVIGYDIATTGDGVQSVEFLGAGLVDEGTLTFTGGTFTDGLYNAVNGPLELSGGSNGELSVARCFLAGTLIRTPHGEIPVEALRKGDLVTIVGGEVLPVRWIGINTVSTRFADPLRTAPIRIKAGAIGENTPLRDLLVSPDHAMFVNGLLIQAAALVNGISITREAQKVESFRYYHIELKGHSLILAEGAPAESFVDNVDRMAFDNWADYAEDCGEEITVEEMNWPRVHSWRQIPTSTWNCLLDRAHDLAAAGIAVAA